MQENELLWQLLAKKLSGEASEEELTQLEALLKKTAYSDIDALSSPWARYHEFLHNTPDVLASKSSEVYDTKVQPDLQKVSKSRKVRLLYPLLRLTGILILLLCSGYFFYFKFSKQYSPLLYSSTDTHKKVILPDGSLVWLNNGSTIKYSLKNATRQVELKGEAYFEVVHKADQPFIIYTEKGVYIRDLGTVFNIKAYENEAMEATLISGSIELYTKNDPGQSLLMHPHEKVIILPDSKDENITYDDKYQPDVPVKKGTLVNCNYVLLPVSTMNSRTKDSLIPEIAWTTNELAFKSRPFSELVKTMERWYQVKIKINDSGVGAYRFTGIFKGETIDQALKELQMIRPFTYYTNQDVITIDK